MPITLTLEQKKDIARRMEEGYRFGREMQAQEAGRRTEAEKWHIADRLMQGLDIERANQLRDLESVAEHGLVIQQRRFMKLRLSK